MAAPILPFPKHPSPFPKHPSRVTFPVSEKQPVTQNLLAAKPNRTVQLVVS